MLKFRSNEVLEEHYEKACKALNNVPQLEIEGWTFRGIYGDATKPSPTFVFKKDDKLRFMWVAQGDDLNDYIV